jgi:DNA-directed RNA polymerase subunit RPC12/RpoP
MDEITFEYTCPKCKELFIGEMPSDQTEYSKCITCECCGHRYVLEVEIDIIVKTN